MSETLPEATKIVRQTLLHDLNLPNILNGGLAGDKILRKTVGLV